MDTYIISAPFCVFPLCVNPLTPGHFLIGCRPKFVSAIFLNFLRNSLNLTVHKPSLFKKGYLPLANIACITNTGSIACFLSSNWWTQPSFDYWQLLVLITPVPAVLAFVLVKHRGLFPFRKQAMPFLTVDAIIGNQTFENGRCNICFSSGQDKVETGYNSLME